MLTIRALFDATAPGVLSESQISLFEQFQTQVDVSFQYGAQHCTYTGVGDVLIEAGSQYYERISIAVPGAPDTHIFVESDVQASGVATFPPWAPPPVGGADGAPAWQGVGNVTDRWSPRSSCSGALDVNGWEMQVVLDGSTACR